MEELVAALRRLSVNEQAPEDLPDLAANALATGVDSPSLRLLAGTPSSAVRDVRDLFIAAMAELGYDLPSPLEGLRAQVRFWVEAMLDRSLSPYEASRRIWWGAYDGLGRPADLARFVGLASEWEDDPSHRPEYEQAMLDEAKSYMRSDPLTEQ